MVRNGKIELLKLKKVKVESFLRLGNCKFNYFSSLFIIIKNKIKQWAYVPTLEGPAYCLVQIIQLRTVQFQGDSYLPSTTKIFYLIPPHHHSSHAQNTQFLPYNLLILIPIKNFLQIFCISITFVSANLIKKRYS